MITELNAVINYIENHLTEDLTSETLESITGGSAFHISKVFLYLTGYTLIEYIKDRRLSKANSDLLQGKSVTEVAFTYGYQSIDGFTRAFKKYSGMVPSEAARTGFSKTVPKVSFKIQVTGGTSMECKIRQMPAFDLAGVSKRVSMQFEGINQQIVQLAMSITEQQRDEMHALQNIDPKEIVNASFDADANFLREEGELTHLIGVLTTKDDVSPLLEKVPVAAMTWAVFPNEGKFPTTLQETMAKIYSEWLPNSDYEVINAPTFSFTKMDKEREGYAYCEVWTPVRKKSHKDC